MFEGIELIAKARDLSNVLMKNPVAGAASSARAHMESRVETLVAMMPEALSAF